MKNNTCSFLLAEDEQEQEDDPSPPEPTPVAKKPRGVYRLPAFAPLPKEEDGKEVRKMRRFGLRVLDFHLSCSNAGSH